MPSVCFKELSATETLVVNILTYYLIENYYMFIENYCMFKG